MASFTQALSEFVQNFVAFVLLIILGIVSFFFAVFIVDWGATLAGFDNHEDVVIAAAILVAAAILAGGISPLGYSSE